VDSHCVGMPGRLERTTHGYLAKVGTCIGFGGRADIVPLAVEDDDQVFLLGVFDGGMKGTQPLRSIGLVEGRLELDGGDEGRDDIDDLAAEGAECGGDSRAITWKPIQEPRRQFLGPRVNPHEHRVSPLAYSLNQTVREVHETTPPSGPD